MTQKQIAKELKVKITSVNAPSQQALERFTQELMRQTQKRDMYAK